MKLKYLIIYSIKQMNRNKNVNMSLLIILIIGLTGIMVATEFSYDIKENETISLDIELNNTSNLNQMTEMIYELKNLKGILDIKIGNNLCIKINEEQNIEEITNLLTKYNYDYHIKKVNVSGVLSPKFTDIIEQICNYMFLSLVIVTQIIFILIFLKKVSLNSNNFSLLKTMGYKTQDILIIIIVELFVLTSISFMLSICLYLLLIKIFSVYLCKYVILHYSINTITKQINILILEGIVVSLFSTYKINKIDSSKLC